MANHEACQQWKYPDLCVYWSTNGPVRKRGVANLQKRKQRPSKYPVNKPGYPFCCPLLDDFNGKLASIRIRMKKNRPWLWKTQVNLGGQWEFGKLNNVTKLFKKTCLPFGHLFFFPLTHKQAFLWICQLPAKHCTQFTWAMSLFMRTST